MKIKNRIHRNNIARRETTQDRNGRKARAGASEADLALLREIAHDIGVCSREELLEYACQSSATGRRYFAAAKILRHHPKAWPITKEQQDQAHAEARAKLQAARSNKVTIELRPEFLAVINYIRKQHYAKSPHVSDKEIAAFYMELSFACPAAVKHAINLCAGLRDSEGMDPSEAASEIIRSGQRFIRPRARSAY